MYFWNLTYWNEHEHQQYLSNIKYISKSNKLHTSNETFLTTRIEWGSEFKRSYNIYNIQSFYSKV